MQIRNWSVIPSGGKLTVDGTDVATGRTVKVREVSRITDGTAPGVFWRRRVRLAVVGNGVAHELV